MLHQSTFATSIGRTLNVIIVGEGAAWSWVVGLDEFTIAGGFVTSQAAAEGAARELCQQFDARCSALNALLVKRFGDRRVVNYETVREIADVVRAFNAIAGQLDVTEVE